MVELKHDLHEQKDMIIISVTDYGLGIKKKNQRKLFKMFGAIKYQKKQINIQGIGLGLVICKMIVSKFNGIIDFISKYKKGSTFYFTFQLDQLNVEEAQRYYKKESS